jgi:hypothetical protein
MLKKQRFATTLLAIGLTAGLALAGLRSSGRRPCAACRQARRIPTGAGGGSGQEGGMAASHRRTLGRRATEPKNGLICLAS